LTIDLIQFGIDAGEYCVTVHESSMPRGFQRLSDLLANGLPVLACDRHIIVCQAEFTSLSRFNFGLQTPTPGFHVELKRVAYDFGHGTMLILGRGPYFGRQGGRYYEDGIATRHIEESFQAQTLPEQSSEIND
jgi:hypothetical protein